MLINGRRMPPGDPHGPSAPTSTTIPAPLVKRVDVLTGGASTVYGSDAMAGVVNFIMDTDFTGVRGGLQYSFYNHDNNNEFVQELNRDAGFDFPDRDGPTTVTPSTPMSHWAASSPMERATRLSISTTETSIP